jgi:soluble lytic murein transglycosylase
MQRALSLTTDVRDRAAALLWMGKGHQAVGNMVEARTALEQAIAADPTGYYSERARELLIGNAPFTPPLAYDLGFDVQVERLGAELWLKSTFGLPEDTVLSEPGPLYDDARLPRGAELWNLGLYNEANDEFIAMRQEYQNDPANLYRLANYLFDLGDYRTAIQAIRQVLTLNGMDDAATISAPALFNRLRFGAYYKDILTPLAQQYGFHPLFLLSVVRQESLFEGFAYSQAGARGLMQIIPTTGQSLADKLGWPPNYTADDLYRPKVSAVFGVDYLASQRDLFNGDLYAALAAYNGGPGNASIWKGLASNDPDLLLEVIRFEESRKYIMGIYEIFSIYQQLYNRTP